MANGEAQSEPTIVTALGRAIDAGQRIIVNRIDLARLDVVDMLNRVMRGGMLIMIGGVLLAVGWLAFSAAAIIFGERYVSLPASAAVVGALNAAIGVGALFVGIQRARPDGGRGAEKG